MAESKLPNEQLPGEVILASNLTTVFQHVKSHIQQRAGFVSGQFQLTRPAISGDDLEDTKGGLIGVLFKTVQRAGLVFTPGDPPTCSMGSSAPVEAALLRMVSVDAADPLSGLTEALNDDDEVIVYDVINESWTSVIQAGTGDEQTSGEPPEGTGIYNRQPKVVMGYVTTYDVEAGDPPEMETHPLFVIQQVLNHVVIFRGNAVGAVGGVDFPVDSIEPMMGVPPDGTVDVSNILQWSLADNAETFVLEQDEGDPIAIQAKCD